MQTLLRNTNAKRRLQERLQFVPRHLTLLSALLFATALAMFCAWPWQTSRTYFSENALMAGSAHMAYSHSHLHAARSAASVSARMREAVLPVGRSGGGNGGMGALVDLVSGEMQRHGCEIMDRHRHVECGGAGEVQYVHGLLRAPRGNGKESIMVSAVVDVQQVRREAMNSTSGGGGANAEASSSLDNAVLLLSLVKYFSGIQWQGHDLSFAVLVVDMGQDDDAAQTSRFRKNQILRYVVQERVLENQFSLIREAIVLDFDGYDFEQMVLQTEGINGEMTNLDMVNVMVALSNAERLWISLFERPTEHFTKAIRGLDSLLNRHPARDASWYRRMSTFNRDEHDYSFEILHLARSWWNQLLGIPTGLHAFFRSNYNIHSITMKDAMRPEGGRPVIRSAKVTNNMVSIARVVEGTVRSMNNLIESLHHSFFIYFLASPVKYHGFDDFFPNLWLFVIPLALQGFILYYTSSKKHLGHSVIVFTLSIAAGFAVYAVPPLVDHMLALAGPFFGIVDHMNLPLMQSGQTFALVWFASVMSVMLILFKLAYPMVADSLYRQWVTGINSRHAAVEVLEEEHRASILDWKSLKSLTLLYMGAVIGVLTVTDSALSVLMAVYLSLLSIIVGTVGTKERIVTRLLRCLVMFLLSPLTLLAAVFALTTMLHSLDHTTYDSSHVENANPDWLSMVNMFFSRVSQTSSHSSLMFNSLYFYTCILCVPAYLVFLKLSLEHLKQAMTSKRKKL